jgi:glycosyltransferase involved in cell wall biosynthesis
MQSMENQKLIIAFDAKRLFNNFTGLGNYSRTLVRNLQTYFPEHEYHLFTPKIIKNEETVYFLNNEKFIVHTPSFNSPMWRSVGMASDINKLRPNIFHGLSHEIPFGIHKSIKTVLTFHDLIYEKYPEQFGLWDRWMYKWKYRSSAKRTDHIIAISESTKEDLISMYEVDEHKISVIYQSCNDVFQIAEEETKLDGILANLSDYYLYVGSIIERKGLLSIIFAYAKLPDEYRKPFVVIGKGDKKYKQKVDDMIKYHGLASYFYFVNGISNERLLAVYDQSFALVFPSIYEGFGIPVIESLFRNKPVITSLISSLPEAAGPGAILVNPYDPDEICLAMIEINDSKKYDRLSRDGYTYVNDRFSSEGTATQLMDFYNLIIQDID